MKPFLIIFGIFLLLAGVGVGVYFYIKGKGNGDDPTESADGVGANNANGGSSPSANSTSTGKDLQRGSTGAEVKKLQSLINKTMNAVRAVSPNNVPAAISEDGNFGAKTEAALQFCTGKKTATVANYAALVDASSKSNRTDLTPQQKQAMSQIASSGNGGTLSYLSGLFGMTQSEATNLYNAAQERSPRCRAYANQQPQLQEGFYEMCMRGQVEP